jgi:hypothetical protein
LAIVSAAAIEDHRSRVLDALRDLRAELDQFENPELMGYVDDFEDDVKSAIVRLLDRIAAANG